MYAKELSHAMVPSPFADEPPRITFECSPPGEMDLRSTQCRLRLTDESGLDFSTYRMTIKEIGREFDMPIEGGMIGRDYESNISFGLLADNDDLISHGKMTVEFRISDISGKETTLEKPFLLNSWRETGILDE
jgi:hypothetical protein